MIRIALAFVLTLAAALPSRAAVDIQQVTSPGGIHAWLVESPEIPFVALEIRFKGGASLDAPGKRGAINLMTGLLEEGAGDMNAREFATARDALAASLSFDVSADAVSVSAQFLTENMDRATDLLHLALVNPRFDADAIERVRGQVQSAIRSDAKNPDKIATRTFDRLAFGDYPYGTSINGTAESLAALNRDDIVAAKDRVMALDRLYVGAVGDISAKQLGALLDRLFAGLPAAGAPMPGPAPFALKGGVTVVPFDTPQSVAVFGEQGIERKDPDFFAAFVLNSILGGSGFSSRLMNEVRVKRGLTYGVGTYLYLMNHTALLLGHVASANNRVAEAVDVIRQQWAKTAADGVTQAELDKAKTYLTGAYPLRFDGNGRIANIMVGMQMDDMSVDYIKTRNEKVNAVTLDDVRRVAARLLDTDALHFVVVGQPKGLVTTN